MKDNSKKRNIYMIPFSGGGNPYIEIQRQTFIDLGYNVLPISSKTSWWKTISHQDIVVANWIISTLFSEKGTFRITGFFRLTIFLLVILIKKPKVIWIKHNPVPHDVKGFKAKIALLWIQILQRISEQVVVHGRDYVKSDKTLYIPHPLYTAAPISNASFNLNPKFLFFGIIREYKKLDALLKIWPKDTMLTIIGSGPVELVNKLKHIIKERGLDVHIKNERVAEEKLSQLFSDFDVIVIPHVESTAIVSGVFLQAKTYGNIVLMPEGRPASNFGDDSGVFYYKNDQDILHTLNELTTQISSENISRTYIRSKSEQSNGVQTHLNYWKSLLKGKRPTMPPMN